MSTQLNKKSVARNYVFLAVMLGSMILGSIVGWIFPEVRDANDEVISAGATVLEPLGTLFLNMMFCIVARTYEPLALYMEVGVIYLLFCTVLTKLQSVGEKKLSAYE